MQVRSGSSPLAPSSPSPIAHRSSPIVARGRLDLEHHHHTARAPRAGPAGPRRAERSGRARDPGGARRGAFLGADRPSREATHDNPAAARAGASGPSGPTRSDEPRAPLHEPRPRAPGAGPPLWWETPDFANVRPCSPALCRRPLVGRGPGSKGSIRRSSARLHILRGRLRRSRSVANAPSPSSGFRVRPTRCALAASRRSATTSSPDGVISRRSSTGARARSRRRSSRRSATANDRS